MSQGNRNTPPAGQGTTSSPAGQGTASPPGGQAPVTGGLIGTAQVPPSGTSFRTYVPTEPPRGPSGRESR